MGEIIVGVDGSDGSIEALFRQSWRYSLMIDC
jgi:hypothetical protein